MSLRTLNNALERRKFLEKELNINLTSLNQVLIDDEKQIHCENLIGAISLPLGVAGPLHIHGNHVKGERYIPMATTEGALVASVARGCKSINLSGGVNTYAFRMGTTRGPVFYTASLEKSKSFYTWMRANEKKLAAVAEKTSNHLKYIKSDMKTLGNYAYVRFYFDTQDAMGMNMVTIASQAINQFIEKETGIKCLSLSGNFCVDKKPAWSNFINNRGYKAWAEVVLRKEIIKTVLKSTAKKIFNVWLAKCMVGSAMSGSLGFNGQFANIIAAVFAATGQDLAHIGEGSMGITTMNIMENEDLYVSVYLPDLMIGTIGGGTKLKTQTETRNIMKVVHPAELVEIISGAVLAGEISLLSSLEEGSLAQTHEKFGR